MVELRPTHPILRYLADQIDAVEHALRSPIPSNIPADQVGITLAVYTTKYAVLREINEFVTDQLKRGDADLDE